MDENEQIPMLKRIRVKYIGTPDQITLYELLEDLAYARAKLKFEREWRSIKPLTNCEYF